MPNDTLGQSSEDDAQTERDEVKSILYTRIRALDATIADAEPETTDEANLNLRRVRELGHLAGQYRKLMKDTDIDEMEEELELLQEATDVMEDKR